MIDKQNKGRWLRRLLFLLVLVALAALLLWSLMPSPVRVELAEIDRGPVESRIIQSGEVRIHDRFVLAAPVAGILARVEVHEGDRVNAGDRIGLLRVPPLDERQLREARARLDGARAMDREARANLERATLEAAQATRERVRTERLVEQNFVSADSVDRARTAEASARGLLQGARSRLEAAAADIRSAEAVLQLAGQTALPLEAPVTGVVLRVHERSARALGAGTPVLTIGDPSRFEIVADVLTTQAVRIREGAAARLVGWGGDPIEARVRLVEPSAFTKVSALGVEEQRVNVLLDPVSELGPLGDGFRVDVDILLSRVDDALRVPTGALFRNAEGWRVFRVRDDRLETVALELGERSELFAEVRAGLSAGDRVVMYPPSTLADGLTISAIATKIR